MRWEKVRQQHQQVGLGEFCSGPGKRWGHTCNAIKGGSFLYVFGGYGRDNCQTNQVDVYDAVKQVWTQPVINGVPPCPRDSHSCTTVGDNLFVFGGTDGSNALKDLHILDTSSHTWICPSVRGDGPEGREGHSATLVGKRLFVFGGCGRSSDINEEIYYNDLYILNTETFVWKHAVTTGNPPSARDSHTCSSWKNNIIVIGGEDGHDYYLSDVHILDTETLVWKELHTSGQLLTPRAGHVTVSLGRNLFVFGGFTDAQNLYDDLYVLDVDTCVWSKILTVGEGPSPRFSSAGACLDLHKAGFLTFVGGCNKDLEALDDMFYLHTGLGYDAMYAGPLSLKKQLKMKCQEQSHESPLYDKGKMMFQARVTESFPVGYTIETIIDGKRLRGVLFSNKHTSILTTDQRFIRKRADLLNGDQDNRVKSPRILSKDSPSNRQVDAIESRDSPLNCITPCDDANKKISDSHDAETTPISKPLDVNINTEATTQEADTALVTSEVKNQDATELDMEIVNTVPETNEASLESRNEITIDVRATNSQPEEQR